MNILTVLMIYAASLQSCYSAKTRLLQGSNADSDIEVLYQQHNFHSEPEVLYQKRINEPAKNNDRLESEENFRCEPEDLLDIQNGKYRTDSLMISGNKRASQNYDYHDSDNSSDDSDYSSDDSDIEEQATRVESPYGDSDDSDYEPADSDDEY